MLRGIDANNTGHYLEAERCFTAVMKLMESAGTADLALARARYALAAVLEATGRDGQALPLLNSALRTLDLALSRGGEYHSGSGNLDHGMPPGLAALRPLETAPETDRDEVATVLVDLGTAYLRTGIYSRGEQVFQRALALQQGFPLKDRIRTITGLAAVYLSQNRQAEAESLLLHEQASLNSRQGADTWAQVLLLNALGNLRLRQQRFADAEQVLRQGQAIAESAPLNPETAMLDLAAKAYVSDNLAQTCLKQKRYREADVLFAAALSLSARGAPMPPGDVVRILEGYARSSRLSGNRQLAATLQARAKAIREGIPGPSGLVDVSALQRLPNR